MRLGNPDQLKVGQWVLAIGSPFGFENTVTAGIVSAKGRSLPDETYVPFIQTDVAVNPGNSGGPLFNLNGEVVGINSQIFSRTGGYQGVSFAIPIDVAMHVQQELVASGHVTRGWLGVGIQGMSKQLAESFGLDQPRGALVSQVQPDSPADKAGLKTGDVILEFDGHAISDSSDLPPLVGNTPVGSNAKIKVLRDGREKTLTAAIEQLADNNADSPARRRRRPGSRQPRRRGCRSHPGAALRARPRQRRRGRHRGRRRPGCRCRHSPRRRAAAARAVKDRERAAAASSSWRPRRQTSRFPFWSGAGTTRCSWRWSQRRGTGNPPVICPEGQQRLGPDGNARPFFFVRGSPRFGLKPLPHVLR